jgi:hypothetical protein
MAEMSLFPESRCPSRCPSRLGMIVAMTRAEMRRELEDLRKRLGLTKPRTIEEWETLPAAVRDLLAARAFIAEWGDKGRALTRLGFPAMNRLPPDRVHLYHDHVRRVFDAPAVQAILKRDLARLDVEREAILSRVSRMALYGDDAESVRAAALLIKVCGWEFRADSAPDTALG